MKKQIVKTMAIAFLVVLVISLSRAPPVASQEFQYPARPYIFIDHASTRADTIGQVFNVSVKINADSFWDIDAYDVTVEYNSTIITLLNETEGGFLKQGGASTWGFYIGTSDSIEAIFAKTSNSMPSSGIDTLFSLQFNVTCHPSRQPISCNLELNHTDVGLWPHPERSSIPPWDEPLGEADLYYDGRPVPPAAPYTHYTIGGTFSVNLGDINNDGNVNLQDLVFFANAYGSNTTSPNWNERADLAPPFGQIGLTDLVTFAVYYSNP